MVMFPKLKKGSKISVCAPSSHAERDKITAAAALLEAQGFIVDIDESVYLQFGQMAGEAKMRAQSLESALLRNDIDTIWLAAGGHRSAEIIPLINWEVLRTSKPKLVLGMSDNSAILNAITHRLGWGTIFAPTLHQIARHGVDYAAPTFSMLQGQAAPLTVSYNGTPATGKLVVCTLSLLPLVIATESLDYFRDAILCIEDINEEYSSIDRLLLHAQLSGVFAQCRALVCGEFINLTDSGRPFGFTLEQIVRQRANTLPVAFDAPFGHGATSHPLPIGAQATLHNNILDFTV